MAAYNNDESQDDPFTATNHLDSSRSSHEIIILQKEDPASSSQQKNPTDNHSQDEYNDNKYSNSKNNPSHDPGRRDHYGLQQAMKQPDISTSQNNDHDDIAVGIVTNLQECQDQKTHPNNNDNNCQNQDDDDGCNNKMKRRSWSMLELNEMKVIHQLQDDLEEILSGQDVAPNQDLDLHSNSHSDMGHDCVVVDKEEEYLFLDDDDDDDDKEDEYDVEENSSRLSMQGSEKAATWLTTVDDPTRDTTTTTSSTTASTSIQTCMTHHGKKSKTNGKRSLWKKIGFRRSMSVGVLHKHSELDSEHSVPVVKDRNISDAEGAQTLSSSSMAPPDISSLDCSHHDVTRHLLVLSLEESFRHSCTLSSPLSVRDLVQEQIVKSPKRNAMKTDKQVVTTAISGIPQSRNDTRTNPPQASSCPPTHFQLDRERMPQSSILKKSTSMMNLKDTTTRQQHDDDVNPQHSSSPRAKNGNKSLKRVTSFSTLEIREYHVTIGDNPGGKQGPPISLDWDYCKDSTVKIDIDSYEQMRPPRRSKHEMYMPGNIRMWTLMKYLGYSLREIEDASKAADVIRKKRAKSIKYHNIYDLKYRVGKLMKIGNMKK